jgi:hypothetical protein
LREYVDEKKGGPAVLGVSERLGRSPAQLMTDEESLLIEVMQDQMRFGRPAAIESHTRSTIIM